MTWGSPTAHEANSSQNGVGRLDVGWYDVTDPYFGGWDSGGSGDNTATLNTVLEAWYESGGGTIFFNR